MILKWFSFFICFTTFLADARNYDQMLIVGSSTVFPFATNVAEKFGRQFASFKTPIVESTGSGGGIKIFCSGIGLRYPDIVNTSRRINQSELKACKEKGITVTEFKIGADGIVIASAKTSPDFNLSPVLIFMALAWDNGFGHNPSTWQEAWSMLPDDIRSETDFPPHLPIYVYGPPSTSGTRDAFNELIMEKGAKQLAPYLKWDIKTYKQKSKLLRSDVYLNSGENDNLIIRKISLDSEALGIFGFSFLEHNDLIIKGARINGITPTFENIFDKSYPLARELFFYVKRNHKEFSRFSGLFEFIKVFFSKMTMGEEDGYLIDKGLIPLTEEERKIQYQKIHLLPELTKADL